jgi:hypothetical protein
MTGGYSNLHCYCTTDEWGLQKFSFFNVKFVIYFTGKNCSIEESHCILVLQWTFFKYVEESRALQSKANQLLLKTIS